MRGTRRPTTPRGACGRIIPAHAGNSPYASAPSAICSDHPRACGELHDGHSGHVLDDGSSPRMRGTRDVVRLGDALRRIIPAHAGNSAPTPHRPTTIPDHPRACGELLLASRNTVWKNGSSPRMRGTPRRTKSCWAVARIIPAHAGNSPRSARQTRLKSDHPRACGELCTGSGVGTRVIGSSPRMRGTPENVKLGRFVGRIIPAHAGNSADRLSVRAWWSDHPRACGELHVFSG